MFFFLATVLLCCSPVFSAEGNYTVGYGDVLRISVYDHPDLATKVRVDDSGQILVPLIDQVKVAGMAIGEISAKLARMLADGYIKDPQVNVFIEEYGSKKAVILGQVKSPGLIDLSGPTTLLELISKAGGLAENAGNTATLKRQTNAKDGAQESITINLTSLLEGGDLSQNHKIQGGDSIFVIKAGMCYVSGEVKKPDAYKLDKETTVIQVITRAGGFTGKASKNGIKITRNIDGKEVTITDVPYETLVQEDDVIVVSESFF
jgi:polysaccharide export outer membrane protein